MSPDATHPVVVLLNNKRQSLSNLEARINVLRKHIRDLNTDVYGNAGATLIGRRDLAGGNYKNDKGLQAQRKVVYWKIDRTFDRMCKQLDGRLGELYLELDNVRSEKQCNATRVQELETEIDRDGIQAIPTLAYSTALHPETSISKKPTGFLDLPGELRNAIYKLSGCLELTCWGGQCSCRPPVHCQCRIWKHLYCTMTVVLLDTLRGRTWVVDATSTKGDVTDAVWHQPSLTRVSKQVRAETLGMYYGNLYLKMKMVSDYPATDMLFKWLRRIGKQNAALIKAVEVTIWNWSPPWGIVDERSEADIHEAKKKACAQALEELGIVTERCKFVLQEL